MEACQASRARLFETALLQLEILVRSGDLQAVKHALTIAKDWDFLAQRELAAPGHFGPVDRDGAPHLQERRSSPLGLSTPERCEEPAEDEPPMTEDELAREIWRLMGSPTPWDLVDPEPLTAENLPPGFQLPPPDAPPPMSAFERLFGFPYHERPLEDPKR